MNKINSQIVKTRSRCVGISAVLQHATSLPNPAAEQQYAAPDIEIIDIETSQNILGGSQLPTMPYEPMG